MSERSENSSNQIYIKLCYSYVLVLLFFYKVKILSIIYYLLSIIYSNNKKVGMKFEVCKENNVAPNNYN